MRKLFTRAGVSRKHLKLGRKSNTYPPGFDCSALCLWCILPDRCRKCIWMEAGTIKQDMSCHAAATEPDHVHDLPMDDSGLNASNPAIRPLKVRISWWPQSCILNRLEYTCRRAWARVKGHVDKIAQAQSSGYLISCWDGPLVSASRLRMEWIFLSITSNGSGRFAV